MADDDRLSPGWLIFLGIVQIVVGILAIGLPHVVGISVSMLLGIVLIVAGGFQIFGAFQAGSWGAGIGGFLGGALYLVAGILCWAHPLATLGALTLLLGMLLVFRGAMQIGVSFEVKPSKGWGWILFGGILGILLGVLILVRWPQSALWFIGLLVGIEILWSGWSLLFLGMGMKSEPPAGAKAA